MMYRRYGLNLDEKTLPEYLNELGYTSHALGKWHLGLFSYAYTPTFRGFDSFMVRLNIYARARAHAHIRTRKRATAFTMKR